MRMPGWGYAPRPKQMKALLKLHPRFSRERDPPAHVSSMQSQTDAIVEIHRSYRRRFRYVPDSQGDAWRPPEETLGGMSGVPILSGDCEDYGLGMMDELELHGFARGACRLATCTVKGLGGHAVLTIDNDWTTLVCDVLVRNAVPMWDSTTFRDYRWHRRQKPGSAFWEWLSAPTLADLAGKSERRTT